MKKLLISILALIFFIDVPVVSAKDKVKVLIFTKDGCPYCEQAKKFLSSIQDDTFEVEEHMVWGEKWNVNENEQRYLDIASSIMNDNVDAAPYIIVADTYSTIGIMEQTKEDIKDAIAKAYKKGNFVNILDNYKASKKYDSVFVIGILATIIAVPTILVITSRKQKNEKI